MVTAVLSPMTYQIQVGDAMWKRHRNQLHPRQIPQFDARVSEQSGASLIPQVPSQPSLSNNDASVTAAELGAPVSATTGTSEPASVSTSRASYSKTSSPQAERRSTRATVRPVRFKD